MKSFNIYNQRLFVYNKTMIKFFILILITNTAYSSQIETVKTNCIKDEENTSLWVINYNCLEQKQVQDDLINNRTNIKISKTKESFDLFEADPAFISTKKSLKSK